MNSNLRLFDTHCHFESADPKDISPIVERAREAGVVKLVAVGGSPELNRSVAAASSLGCLCAVGYDREQVNRELPPVPTLPLVAWGEIGLDYYYSPETRSAQCRLFAEQLEEAARRDLPVSIHTRDADDDTLAILREVPARGIIHCFTGSPEFARRLLDLGFYASISGIVTFRAAENVRAAALAIPDDRLLIETDSPFLAPVPMRGNPNEPAYLVHTCRFLAALRSTTPEHLADLTYTNACKVFNLT